MKIGEIINVTGLGKCEITSIDKGVIEVRKYYENPARKHYYRITENMIESETKPIRRNREVKDSISE